MWYELCSDCWSWIEVRSWSNRWQLTQSLILSVVWKMAIRHAEQSELQRSCLANGRMLQILHRSFQQLNNQFSPVLIPRPSPCQRPLQIRDWMETASCLWFIISFLWIKNHLSKMSNRHFSLHGFAETTCWMVMFRMKHQQNARSWLTEKQSGFDDTRETWEIMLSVSQGESLITSASFLLIVALKGVLCALWLKWSVKTVFLLMCHLNKKNGCKRSILWKMSNHSSHSVQSKQSCLFRNIWLIRRSMIFRIIFSLFHFYPLF